jgi:hypothetical protein
VLSEALFELMVFGSTKMPSLLEICSQVHL